jgi:MFS family permease
MRWLGDYLTQLRRFQPNARRYLFYSFASGFAMGILRLLFNFYVLSLGYDRAFLGTLVALPPLVIAVLAIPAGMLSHRIGLRLSLIVGAALMVGSIFGASLSAAAAGLILFSISRGLGRTLLSVSNAPFMTENSESIERTHLFSVEFATRLAAMFVGSSIAGALPTLVAWIASVGPEDALAYRASLWICAAIYALAILPLVRLRRDAKGSAGHERSRLREMFRDPGQLARLFIPQVVIGFGAGVLVPFLNVYFKERFGLSDITVGFLFAFQSVFMAIATLAGPILANRLRRVRAVVFVQLLSIPFLILLGYAPFVSLSALGFFARASLMNMGNPLYTAFAMESVEPARRPTASALMQMSWQGTRSFGSMASGYIQEESGFSALFPITIGCYLLASGLIYAFFVRKEKLPASEEAGS